MIKYFNVQLSHIADPPHYLLSKYIFSTIIKTLNVVSESCIFRSDLRIFVTSANRKYINNILASKIL
jgi:hypothetical protein